MAEDLSKQNQNSFVSKDLYPTDLKFGGKQLASINVSKKDFENMINLNTVYTNVPSITNAGKGQFHIDPNTLKVTLGKARVKPSTGTWQGKQVNYNIYLNTIAIKEDQTTVTPPVVTPPSGGGGENEDNENDNENDNTTGGGSTIIVNNTGLEYYQLKELLQVLQVVYDQSEQRKHETITASDVSLSNVPIVGFSYKFDLGQSINKLNSIKIKTDSTNISGDVYCVLRKCKEMFQSGGVNYTPPTELTQYVKDSQVLTVSKCPAIIKNGFFQWNFSKHFNLEHATNNVVYLITFHDKKIEQWDEDSLVSINVGCSSESSVESKLQYVWDSELTSTNTLSYAVFSYNTPIGAIIK